MRFLVPLFLASTLSMLGCAKSESQGESSDSGSVDCDDNGALLFPDYCAGCHGADGVSGSSPALDEAVPSLSDDALIEILMNGTGGMVAPSLTTCQEEALFTYLRDTFGEEGGG